MTLVVVSTPPNNPTLAFSSWFLALSCAYGVDPWGTRGIEILASVPWGSSGCLSVVKARNVDKKRNNLSVNVSPTQTRECESVNIEVERNDRGKSLSNPWTSTIQPAVQTVFDKQSQGRKPLKQRRQV